MKRGKKVRLHETITAARRRRLTQAVALLPVCCMLVIFAQPVWGGNAASIINSKFNILNTLMSAVISSIGTLVTLWGLFEYGNAMNTGEGGAHAAAFKRIGGGLLMMLAPQLIALFT